MNYSASESAAIYLAHNSYLRVILAARVTAAALAIVLLISLGLSQGYQIALHINAKILILNHGISMILYCFAVMIVHGLDLKTFMTYTNVEDLMISKSHCLLGQVPMMMSWGAIMITLGMMAFERAMATNKYRIYEKKSGKGGFILLFVQWFIVAIGMTFLILNIDLPQEAPTCYLTIAANSFRAAILLILMAIAEISALITFYWLLHINKVWRKRVASSGALTEKYQLDENIRATKIMIPMVLTHFVCLFPPMCLLAIYTSKYNNGSPDVQEQNYTIFKETTDLMPWYCLILPLVIFWRRKAIKINLRKNLTELGLNQVHPLEPLSNGRTHEQIRHFQLLTLEWNSYIRPV